MTFSAPVPAKSGALANVDPASVLARYEQGERIADIANSHGVSDVAIYRWLLTHAEDAWREHQAAHALSRLERAEADLADAERSPDAVSIARARELARSAQWKLERTWRRIYGQDVPANLAAVQISINLRTTQPQAIDAQAIRVEAEADQPQEKG